MGQRWGEYYTLPCHSIPRCRIWSPLNSPPLLLRLHKRIVELVSSSQPRHWRNSPEQKNSSYCNTTPGERQVTACRGTLRKNGIRCDVSVELFSSVFGMKFLVKTSRFTVIKYNHPITSNLYSFFFFGDSYLITGSSNYKLSLWFTLTPQPKTKVLNICPKASASIWAV